MSRTPASLGVLFVCTGNICRSPAGAGVYRHYVREAGFADLIGVDSAGTIDYHAGEAPDARMQAAAARRGYVLDSIARQVTLGDLSDFDVIVAMDHEHLRALARLAGGRPAHLRLLGTFLGEAIDNDDAQAVPDPYYGGPRGFELVLDMIESACPQLLAHCLDLREQRPAQAP